MRMLIACLALLPTFAWAASPDILFADFESDTYAPWTATGEAFGKGPAKGTLPGQMNVSGYEGNRLVNSFFDGDRTTGKLTSPAFKIERRYINFLIGGGGYAGQTCMNLLVDGTVVRTATGPNTKSGGSEELEPAGWDVAEHAGKAATIEIVDAATGGWGHINVDHVVFSDTKSAAMVHDAAREWVAEKAFLHLPVKNGAKLRKAKVFVDGRVEREFDIEIGTGDPDWHAPLDISAWRGKTLKVQVDRLPGNSKWLTSIEQGDAIKGAESFYREPLRPQLHVSPSRGWNNDPNGMVYYGGEYHLFFQLNPYGTNWGNMHWGHAVSKDLVHWRELPIALYPDRFGTMFSGSAVMDMKNTSGFGRDGKPPMVLLYTAAGNPFTQCLAYSTDGRTFTKHDKNPVVPHISGGNRDPKVIWHEPSGRWVMVLYVDRDKKHFIDFLTSPDLKTWTPASTIESFYECPDFFELPIDGDAKNTRWVLTGASSEYILGRFDGKTFTPQTPKLKGHLGRGFYAAQTFSDVPDGRRIQIGWFQAPSPGMPFNQAMTVPLEMKLISTADGPRMTWMPVKELQTLRAKSHRIGPMDLKPGDANPLAGAAGELLEVRVEFEPADAAEVALNVRGVRVYYDVKKQELIVNGHRAPASLRNGRQRLVVLADRTGYEIFASDGLTYVPFPVIPKADDRSVQLQSVGGAAKIIAAEVHELRSIWNAIP